jgi:hypothetical protein
MVAPRSTAHSIPIHGRQQEERPRISVAGRTILVEDDPGIFRRVRFRAANPPLELLSEEAAILN